VIFLPEVCWDAVLDAFRRPWRSVERVAFLDGVGDGAHAIVTTVTVPNARLARRYYDVSPEAMSEAAKHMRRNGLVRVAQVHTHGGSWLGHSPRDDTKAYSQKPGAVSIVLPDHSRGRPRVEDGAVHLRGRDDWRRLNPEEASALIRLVPSLVDLRR
jgi:hypothetical protein